MARAATTTDVFNAVAEPRRREIIGLLSDGREWAVNDVVLRVQLGQPAVSKHLGVLRKVGVVTAVKRGHHRMYSLDAARLKPIHDWVKTFEQYWTNQIGRIKQRAEEKAIEKIASENQARGGKTSTSQNLGKENEMPVAIAEQAIHTLQFVKEEEIAAPIDVVFETILEEMGPLNEAGANGPMPMKLEAWPGGRWFRDLGSGAGHWWGSVQAIKPPSLLEICGPLFMSCPAISNVQYRLAEENGITRLKFSHRAMGYIAYDPQIQEGWSKVETGWGTMLERIRMASLKK